MQQRVKIRAPEQHGTAGDGGRTGFLPGQTVNRSLLFRRLQKRAAQPIHRFPAQQRLVARRKQTAAELGSFAQQGVKPQTHGVAPMGKGVQQHGYAQRNAQPVDIFRARDDDARRNALGRAEHPAQHRLTTEIREQLVRAEPPRQSRGHDDRADRLRLHRESAAQSALCPHARIPPGSFRISP